MKGPEADFFRDLLRRANPTLAISHCPDVDSLTACAKSATDKAASSRPRARLIAFSTQVVAPRAILERLSYNAYNFHPGPPDYPGSKPSAFAIYEGARNFGVTLHRMAARVDSGEIVAVDRFPIADAASARDVAIEAYGRMARLALTAAPALAQVDRPLPPDGSVWRGVKRRMADYEALRVITPGLSQSEVARRFAACDGIYCPLPSGAAADEAGAAPMDPNRSAS